jgi:outer membrane receptor protein involved in Fe transport
VTSRQIGLTAVATMLAWSIEARATETSSTAVDTASVAAPPPIPEPRSPPSSKYEVRVRAPRESAPARDGTSTSTLTSEQIANIPGGSTRPFNDVLATQVGIVRDNYGAIHARGNFAGVQLRVDGIQLPPAIQKRLQQLLDAQIIERTSIIIGGLPAEFGEDVAAVIDVKTKRATEPEGQAQLAYGTYEHVDARANMAGKVGPFGALMAGMLRTTSRGLDPEAATPILHDDLREGRVFLRVDGELSSSDQLQLLGIYAESHYQIPIDPTLLPLSAGPPNAMRGMDQYGNNPPTFVPYDSDPGEFEREALLAIFYRHTFEPRMELQVAPFVRHQLSELRCDPVHQLGATADPGTTCSSVNHNVVQGGLQASQTIGVGDHNFKTGVLIDAQHSTVDYAAFSRDDASPEGGVDEAATASGSDPIDTLLVGVYVQDRIELGKLTIFPGLRFDVMRAKFPSIGSTSLLWGPSYRLGVAYAFSRDVVVHGFVGRLWQAPTFDAPTAARALGLIAPASPVPLDLKAEEDDYAEIGIEARILPQLKLSFTPWGRLSKYTIDDNEVGDTALTAEYNYAKGRAVGVDFGAHFGWAPYLRTFANLSIGVSEGAGIISATYLFTRQQLGFSGYQATDNAQFVTANVGFDLSNEEQTTHFSGLMTYGSGLRTGPTNNATLPPNVIFDATLRHRFDHLPLKPEVAFDVENLFNVVYAYRIATGSLAGTSYGSLRQFNLRLLVRFGG